MKINLQLFAKKTVTDDIVKAVINGKYGNGQARKTALANAGYDYSEVQAAVNAKLNGTSTTKKTTTTSSTTNKNNTATNSGFKPSATTDAYKNTVSQKEKELSALGKFTYDDYVQPDTVTEAFNKLNALQKPGEFQYGNQQMLDDVFNKIMNGEKFTYDVNGDALYQQYKDQFVNQGQLAMQDAMGQAAAMTGGYGSSYAQSVGQQTYQGYLQKLTDKIPELYQLALEKHNMDRQELKDQYGMLLDDRNYEHGLHREAVDDYNTERAYLTDEARWQSDDAWDKYKTGEEQRFNEYSTEYGIIKDALDRADTNYWSSYGQDYKAAQDKIANDLALAQLQLDRDKLTESKRQFNIENGYDENGKKKIVDPVYTPKPADPVVTDNKKDVDTSKGNTYGQSDYSHAVDYAVSQGVSEAAAAGMMTKREWLRRGKPNGTYEDYVDAIIAKYTKKK